jgi:tetratricopeptide (TPR) repeat protein
MPSSVNGIGPHYVGKQNLEARLDFCDHCHGKGQLQSYDTRLWFVLLFLPIVPLGRKRVLDYCPACTRHRVVDLDKWEQAKQVNLRAAMEKFKAHPTPEAAIAVHAMLVGVQQGAQAAEFRKMMAGRFADNARVQAYLGQAAVAMGQPGEAAPCFARAYQLDPNLPEARAGMAMSCIRDGRLDEARGLLAFLEAPDAARRHALSPLNDLALAYQQAGRHQEALELFGKLLAADPALAQDRAYRKVVKVSEEVLGRRESSLPPRIVPWKRIIGWSAAGGMVLILLLGSNLYIAGHRQVFVVNGFAQPVTVSPPSGRSFTVPAGTFDIMALPEGNHRITCRGAVTQAVDVAIRGSFFGRWFDKTAFVLNPGGAALVYWERATYSAKANAQADRPSAADVRFWYGEPFTTFHDIDYAFEPFPENIRTKVSKETKTRIDLLRVQPMAVFVSLLAQRSYEEALRLAEWDLRLQPRTNALLLGYAGLAKMQNSGARAVAFLREGLARRPVDIAWHRTYQELLSDAPDDRPLAAEYDAYLRAEPTNSSLLYLRGRISVDAKEAESCFRRAIAADPNNGYAHNGLGFQRFTLGDWAGARREIGCACELRPEEESFAQTLTEIRLALGEFDSLEGSLRAYLERSPLDQYAVMKLSDVLVAQGKNEEARQWVTAYEREAVARFKREAAQQIMPVRRNLHYAVGDFAALEKTAGGDSSLPARQALFQALIETGRVAEAVKVFPINDPQAADPWRLLIVSIAWQRAGAAPQAAAWRDRAAELFARSRREWRPVAGILRRTQPPPLTELIELPLTPKPKAILLVALAQRFPAQSAELLAKARLFNVDRSFPYWLIERSTK